MLAACGQDQTFMPPPLQSLLDRPLGRYGCAVVAVALAAGVRVALDPILGNEFDFLTFFAAVLVTAWAAGPRAAVLAGVLGGVAASFLFLPPRLSLAIAGGESRAGLGLYAAVVTGIVLFARAMQKAYDRADAARRQLEQAADERRRVESQLERYRLLSDHTGDIVLFIRTDGRIVEANAAAAAAYGYDREDLLKLKVTDLRPPETVAEVPGQLAAANQSGLRFETLHCRKDGTTFPVEVSSRGADIGGERLMVSIIRDVTARKRAEAALRESEARFRALMEQSPLSTQVFAPDGRILRANRAWEELWGITPDQIPDYNLLTDPQLAAKGVMPYIRRGFAGEAVAVPPIEYDPNESIPERSRHADPRRWVTAVIYPLKDEAGRVLEVVLVHEDITARKRAEEAVRAHEAELERLLRLLEFERARMEAVLRQLPSGVIVAEAPSGRIILANDQAERILRHPVIPSDEVTGYAEYHGLHPDGRPYAAGEYPLARALAGETVTVEMDYRAGDGQLIRLLISAAPVRGANGGVVAAVVVFSDVTAQRRAEADLRESERRYRWLVENTVEAVWRFEVDEPFPVDLGEEALIDHAYRHAYLAECNEGMARIYGFPSAAAMAGMRLGDLMPRDEPANVEFLRTFARSGFRLIDAETIEMAADGSRRYLLNSLVGEVEGGRLVRAFGTSRDVTERRLAEEALRESQRFIERVARTSPAILFVHDLDERRNVYANRDIGEELGYPPGESGGAGPAFLARVMHPDDRPPGGEAISPFEKLSDGEVTTLEYRMRHADGSWRWRVSYLTVFARHPDGRPRQLMGVSQDITDRKRAEEALREADRRKDEFLATLAHELRNPLAPIRNALKILQLAGGDPVATASARAVMDRQMSQMVRLIDDLLDVSRISRDKLVLRTERIALAAVVQSAVEASRPMFELAGLDLTVALPSNPILLDADPVRLAQVFTNLLNNAAKFTDRGGRVWLTAECAAGEVTVIVRDTGVGIPSEMLPRVFDLFTQADRTLERSRGGLGIGLTLVRRLVELHGGRVEADSPGPGQGSSFTVRLPLPADDKKAIDDNGGAARPGPLVPIPGPRLRIVVADDNRDAATSLTVMLGLLGHEVHTAFDGTAAVELAGVVHPDVMFLDIGMPQLSGYDAARRIREAEWGRGVRLVAVTGWGQEEDRRRSKEAGFDHHLVKPVDPEELRQMLSAAPRAKGQYGVAGTPIP
jgi:PAS domain S-box-containing protein